MERPVSATTYVGQHLEVREHDAPIKYIFAGPTRVARVTSTLLSSNTRVQRLRVWAGWNLCSIAVTAPNALLQLSNNESHISIEAAYKYDASTKEWSPVDPHETILASTVLWLSASTNGIIRLTGLYPGPSPNPRAPPDGTFLPSHGLEVWDFKSAISNLPSLSAWKHESSDHRWLARLPSPLTARSTLPSFIAPGEAVFVQSDSPIDLELPDPALSMRFYHQDHLGSTTCITDAEGKLVTETANYPFGHPRHQHQPTTIDEAYQFTQKERDSETAYSYFETRYYHPALASFMSPDSFMLELPSKALTDKAAASRLGVALREPQRWNLYNYALRNPNKFIDPGGQDPELVETPGFLKNTPYALKDTEKKRFTDAVALIKTTEEGRRIMNVMSDMDIRVQKGKVPFAGTAAGATDLESVSKPKLGGAIDGGASITIDFNYMDTHLHTGLNEQQKVKLLAWTLFHELRHVEGAINEDESIHNNLDQYRFPSVDLPEKTFQQQVKPPVGPDGNGGFQIDPSVP